ncbi:MAG: 2TM domain-containing protein [Acidimicrobiales bacterium]|nr:2TM domain-containing protein [Acidimicrobiales bacterium]
MDDFARAAFREREARSILRHRVWWLHAAVYLVTNVAIVGIWFLTDGEHPWFLYPILGWGIGLAAHAAAAFLMSSPQHRPRAGAAPARPDRSRPHDADLTRRARRRPTPTIRSTRISRARRAPRR